MAKDPRSLLLRIRLNLGGEFAIFLACLGAGITFGFALEDANYSEAHTLQGVITLLSRFTALIGTYLALIALLIIARIPWVEKSIGFDSLVAYHRKLGPVIYWLITSHVFLVILGYSLADGQSLGNELVDLIKNYTWMLQAVVGFFLLSLISITSTRALRRRFKYEQWWNIHLLSYFAIAFSFMHQILNGSLFIFNEVAKIWWIGIYLYTSFALVMWRFLTRGIWSQAHPYSLSESPSNEMMRITVKNLGDHSWALSKLAPGTRVLAEGPYGILTASRAIGKKILLVGAGVGITPIRALINDFPADAEVDLIYRTVLEEELILRKELDEIDKEDRIRIHYLVGTPEKFPMSPDDLIALIPHISECDVFVCGPPGLAELVRHSVESLGVNSAKFHNEAFSFHAK